jgi:NADPH:quinone reductase
MSVERSYPQTMQAVFIEKKDGPLVVREVKVPDPGPNEVLIKISAAPVNPSDLARLRTAHKDQDLTIYIPGLEGSGTVVAAGKGILPKLWMGKRVACSSAFTTSGTWAEYMVTKASDCFALNKRVTDEQGAMSLVNPLTAISFFEIARKKRSKAIINNAAASALGRMVELLGKKYRIPVINLVRNPKQVEMLKSLGSEIVLDSSDPFFIDSLRILSDELSADLLFDSVCSSQLGKMVDVLPAGSTVIIYGNLSGELEIMVNPRTLIANDIKIEGFYLGNRAKSNGIFKNVMELREVGKLMSADLKIKIRERFPLSRAQEAVDTYIGNMSAGKILLIPGLKS